MSFEFEVVTSLCPKRNCTIPRYLVLWNELSGVKDLSDPPKGKEDRGRDGGRTEVDGGGQMAGNGEESTEERAGES